MIGVAVVMFVIRDDTFDFVAEATAFAIIVAIIRQTLVLADQTAYFTRERQAAERDRERNDLLQLALTARGQSEARYRSLVQVFDRLGEQATFAADEGEMYTAAAAALGALIPTQVGEVLSINPSAHRLSVILAWGRGRRGAGLVGRRRSAGCRDSSRAWQRRCLGVDGRHRRH